MSFADSNSPPPAQDPRLQPTPDYGTLGPGSDLSVEAGVGAGLQAQNAPSSPRKIPPNQVKLQVIVAVVGALIAILTSTAGTLFSRKSSLRSSGSTPDSSLQFLSGGDLDRQKPQKQAEILLERAVSHGNGATDQISNRVGRWRGKLQWDSQLSALTTAALNSKEQDVRVSGIEVELAAYGLEKNQSNVSFLVRQADSSNHAQRIWALWALGLMANRGVQTEQIVPVLTAHLKDSDEDSRRWAVEGLALTGSTSAIMPLLATMHDDGSPTVRERAACGLAESGMFTDEQRLSTVRQLISYSEDPSLDAQTHGWAFQALGDITHQNLPNDSAAWRKWYESQ